MFVFPLLSCPDSRFSPFSSNVARLSIRNFLLVFEVLLVVLSRSCDVDQRLRLNNLAPCLLPLLTSLDRIQFRAFRRPGPLYTAAETNTRTGLRRERY